MLAALLVVLGVNLAVVAVLLVGVVGRRRWVSHQPGAFRGIARFTSSDLHQKGTRPHRGYGRWVSGVLVWCHTPLLLRNTLAPVDRVETTAKAAGRVRRMGESPQVVTLASGDARIAITVRQEDQERAMAAFAGSEPR